MWLAFYSACSGSIGERWTNLATGLLRPGCWLQVDLSGVGGDGASSKPPRSLERKLGELNPKSFHLQGLTRKVAETPSSWYPCAIEDQRIEASFYSLSCIHTQRCIHNQVYSPAALCLWFPSHAAPKLCFINSCTIVPTHSCTMNNSYSQTEKERAQNKYQRWQGSFLATGPVYLSLFLPLLFLTPSPSVSYMCVCVCLLLLRTVSLPLLHCINLFTIVSIMAIHLSHSKQKFFFFVCVFYFVFFFPTLSVFDCRWILSFSSFVLLSGWEITICLIVGDARTPQQLGYTQIICYTSLPPLPFFLFVFLLPLFISQLFLLSFTPLLFLSPLPLHWILSSGGGCHSSHSHICEMSAHSDKWLWWENAKWTR